MAEMERNYTKLAPNEISGGIREAAATVTSAGWGEKQRGAFERAIGYFRDTDTRSKILAKLREVVEAAPDQREATAKRVLDEQLDEFKAQKGKDKFRELRAMTTAFGLSDPEGALRVAEAELQGQPPQEEPEQLLNYGPDAQQGRGGQAGGNAELLAAMKALTDAANALREQAARQPAQQPQPQQAAGGMSPEAIAAMERLAKATEAQTALQKDQADILEMTLTPERGETPEGYLHLVFETLARLEQDPRTLLQKKDAVRWERLTRTLDKLGREHPDFGPRVTIYRGAGVLERQISFVDALKEVVETRARFRERAIEIAAAGGNLSRIGVGKEAKDIEDIPPENWWIMTHLEDLFPTLNVPEARIRVTGGLEEWEKIADAYDTNTGTGYSKSFVEAVTNAASMRILEGEMARRLAGVHGGSEELGGRAGSLAYDFLTCSLTIERWDKARKKKTGKADARDLMFIDEKRKDDAREKGLGGPAGTVGRFWYDGDPKIGPFGTTIIERELPGEVESPLVQRAKGIRDAFKAATGGFSAVAKDVLSGKRVDTIFEQPRNIPNIIGDLFESTVIEGRADGILRPLSDSPWKDIPFWDLPENFYTNYFTYSLMFANLIAEDYILKNEWSPSKVALGDPENWSTIMNNVKRMDRFCPAFYRALNQVAARYPGDTEPEKEARKRAVAVEKEKIASMIVLMIARGALWVGAHSADSRWTNENKDTVLSAIDKSKVLGVWYRPETFYMDLLRGDFISGFDSGGGKRR